MGVFRADWLPEAKFGLGQHVWMQPDEDFIPYSKSFYSSIVVYNVGLCLVKMSILFQYRRIFSGKTMQRLTLAMLCFEGVWATILCFLLPLVCWPVAKFWKPELPGHCLNQLAIWYVMASINMATDFTVFAMPLPVVNRLQLPKKQKVMLMFVFCLGFL